MKYQSALQSGITEGSLEKSTYDTDTRYTATREVHPHAVRIYQTVLCEFALRKVVAGELSLS